MAYYTGQCTSYQHLADILVEHCQKHGWVWQDGILSKNDLFIQIFVVEQRIDNYHVRGQGITLIGGTGKQTNQLINPAENPVRLGRTVAGRKLPQINYFPAHYHLFIFANEVYLFMKFDIDKFYYLAFGKSNLLQNTLGSGLWLSATCQHYSFSSDDGSIFEIIYLKNNGGGASGGYGATVVAPFWNRQDFYHNWSNSVICHGLDNLLWSNGKSRAYCTFEPLIDRLPTNHFADSPLLPYNIYLERPENKLSLIAQLENARCVRIDNYEPEQIISLGHEKWMVFPFYRKNLQYRDVNSGYSQHTGTFGWAIRFDG